MIVLAIFISRTVNLPLSSISAKNSLASITDLITISAIFLLATVTAKTSGFNLLPSQAEQGQTRI